jgi:hypothetical protein
MCYSRCVWITNESFEKITWKFKFPRCLAWWHRSVVPAHGRLRHKDPLCLGGCNQPGQQWDILCIKKENNSDILQLGCGSEVENCWTCEIPSFVLCTAKQTKHTRTEVTVKSLICLSSLFLHFPAFCLFVYLCRLDWLCCLSWSETPKLMWSTCPRLQSDGPQG